MIRIQAAPSRPRSSPTQREHQGQGATEAAGNQGAAPELLLSFLAAKAERKQLSYKMFSVHKTKPLSLA